MASVAPLPVSWGIRPVLFNVGDWPVQSYAFFVGLGILTGVAIYLYESRRKHQLNENGLYIALGSLVGGMVGAKLLEWLVNIKFILANISNWTVLLSGRTIIGGLIGGTVGAMVTKRFLKITDKRGNLFAPAIALGVAVGRIGCFLRGCC
ncbi:MAG: prolipoprotein diacylglyceryl transferase family protein, partial [Patescibacteria group bacterium]